MRTDTGRPLLLVALLIAAVPAAAQPPDAAAVRGDSAQTRKRLAEAEAKALGAKPADAIDELQRVLDDAGDDLIAVDAKQFRPARWVAHAVLAKLRGDALKAYQDRIEEPARKLLAAGRRDRDPRPLWALLDQYFVSRPSEEGLELLGELLFERGEFRAAELVWRRLSPDGDIPYPSPKSDPAGPWARAILAVIFQGDLDRATAELAAFRGKHPAAAGALAGKNGAFADALQALLDSPPRLAPTTASGTWETVGGGPERSGRVAGRLPIHWPARPTWTVPIAVGKSPLGHPVIAGGRVYVADGRRTIADSGNTIEIGRITSYDLVTGATEVVSRDNSAVFGPLTVADGRLYARLGPQHVSGTTKTEIVCYGPAAPGGTPLKELWRLSTPDSGEMKVPTVWEGAPLVAGRRMWAALARFEGGRVAHAIACYDPADADRVPDRPAWVTDVSDSPLPQGGEGRARHELLTRAGRNVVFCTHTGAVVAVDAVTGRKAWAFRYPRAAKRTGDAHRNPDPAPPVAFGGRVFVAPADADRVYALDAETGQFLWESVPADGAQVLGVSRGRVIVTVTGQVRGIRALSVRNGSQREPDGWVQHDGGAIAPHGRGVVTDDVIAWPTKAGLIFLRPDDGLPLRDPLLTGQSFPTAGLFGNVASADGCLVIVTASQVLGYVSEEKRFGRPVAALDEHRQFTLRTDRAEEQVRGGDTLGARATLADAVTSGLPTRMRAWAAARLLFLAEPGTEPPELRGHSFTGTLIGPNGELVSLQELVRRHTGRPPEPGSRPSAPNLALEEVPSLTPTADIEHTVPLPSGSHPLPRIRGAAPPKHLFAVAGPDLVAVTTKGGTLPPKRTDDPLTHAADFPGGVVAAGPWSVAVYGPDARPEWVFRVPDTDPLPARPGFIPIRTEGSPRVPQLSSFALAGSWLFARIGDHHIVALDLTARRVAWVLGSHGRLRYEPVVVPSCPRFEPHYYLSEHALVPQLSDGRRWSVRTESGRVANEVGSTFLGPVPLGLGEPTARVAWPSAPVDVSEGRVAFADGPGVVRECDPRSNRPKWKWTAPDPHSLTGEPPQVRAWAGGVLVAVRRNYGVEVDRVKVPTGASAWVKPGYFETDRIDLAAADADPWRVYIPVGNKLTATTLSRGKHVWEADLPETNGAGGWVVRAGRRAVIAYPAAAIPAEAPLDIVRRLGRSLWRQPFTWRLPAVAAGLYDAWVERTVPVLLFDPECGKLLKRIDVPARGPGVTAAFTDELAVVMTGDRVVWIK